MELAQYFNNIDGKIQVSREQASDFAKHIAGDFNPIHDVDAKRFCVPGDLLFSIFLSRCGVAEQMCFTFSGMVNDKTQLNFPEVRLENAIVTDEKEKEYVNVESRGETTIDPIAIHNLILGYVQFSGKCFPHQLVPLMKSHDVMINPSRPFVIYDSMSIKLDTLEFDEVALNLTNTTLEVDGKRGDATFAFSLESQRRQIGVGNKKMVLSGLRAFDEEGMNSIVDMYIRRMDQFGLADVE